MRHERPGHGRLSHASTVLTVAVSAVAAVVALAACTSSASSTGNSGASSTPATLTSGPTSGGSRSDASATSSHSTSGHHTSRSPLPKTDPAPLHTVATRPVRTRSAVPLRSPAPFGNGVSARVTSITHGTDHDRGPGAETGRPTVVFHVRLINATSRSISVATVQVNASYGSSRTPAVAATSSTTPFKGTLRAGRSADAAYAFAVPDASQGSVQLTVTYTAGRPTVLLTGSAR